MKKYQPAQKGGRDAMIEFFSVHRFLFFPFAARLTPTWMCSINPVHTGINLLIEYLVSLDFSRDYRIKDADVYLNYPDSGA